MALNRELGLNKPIVLTANETILNIYYTASLLKKRADDFFRPFGLTDVQFNALMLLHHQDSAGVGLSQATISKMMLVNKANTTSLVDRMEKAGLVIRCSSEQDRRCKNIKLTAKGRKLLDKAEPAYAKEVNKLMSILNSNEQKKLIRTLEKVREKLKR